MQTILTVVGARPQFIKTAVVHRAFQNSKNISQTRHILVHTGQHYDNNMSQCFFDELEIPQPDHHLGIGDLGHGAMTGNMLMALEPLMIKERPDVVLVYGDTNSTLAGALTAVKLHIPVAHVEAGLRSFNLQMPEEINRILTDRMSSFLFCPTETAVENLKNEGCQSGVHFTGDVMQDVSLFYGEKARSEIPLSRWNLAEKKYVLTTVHRAENTDDPDRLKNIFEALGEIARECPVILPLHPRTRNRLETFGLMTLTKPLQIVSPLGYLEMARLEMSAKAILTDSGGIQKEAYFYRVPCLTLREETEWVETVSIGWNHLCGYQRDSILKQWKNLDNGQQTDSSPYGQNAAEKIVALLQSL